MNLELLGEYCKDFMPYLQLISNFKQQLQSLKLLHNSHLKSLYQLKGKCHQMKIVRPMKVFSTKQKRTKTISNYVKANSIIN